ncbi:MAG: low-specificity L-threonine aldolase [Anaerolineae bacterium]|nr:low-specificity L-threonine aldolase [Anaerolineae bacterium]
MDKIDLRSDTVSWPTEKMRQAMAAAPVGDDVYGEDPTVNQLEKLAAEKLGKEAGLFVTSGTMGNVVSILTHCGRGDEVILGDKSHAFINETGNPAAYGGVHSWPVEVQPDGTLPLEKIKAAIRADNVHYPITTLVCLENTQAAVGGQPLPVEYMDAVGALCHEHGLKLHIDGARIFNAAVAVDEDVKRVVQAADSVQFCLSKGLCAPVGSMIVGSADFIRRARRIRKAMGGGLRQAGILAAAGIIALEEMTERLAEDHAVACILAEGLATIPHIQIDPSQIRTNIVLFSVNETSPLNAPQLAAALEKDNILIRPVYTQNFRAVTHYWITPERARFVVERIRSYLT